MEENDTYCVMRKWIDVDDEESFIVESYYTKEKALKLRDLLNEFTEMDAVYLVDFNGREIKE